MSLADNKLLWSRMTNGAVRQYMNISVKYMFFFAKCLSIVTHESLFPSSICIFV